MDKAITSGLLIIASVIASIALINAVIPAMSKSSGALVTANAEAADRIRTDIEVIHVASKTSPDQVIVWVKNIGSTQSVDADESTTDWVDLMFHLHGILTGGFPVVKIPHIRLPLREETKEEDDGY